MLALVAKSLKPVKLFRPMQTDATLLANNTQQSWELLALVVSVCMGLKEQMDFDNPKKLRVIVNCVLFLVLKGLEGGVGSASW